MRKFIILFRLLLSFPKKFFSKLSLFSIIVDSSIDKSSAICSFAKVYRTTMGKYSYIGRNSFITNVKIGSFCSIAGDCYIGGTSHPVTWVSTSSVFHKWENILKINFSSHEFNIFDEINIGNDVWIGTKVLIKSGVNISDGAIIGMGSVVTKDVGPYEIWAGNPARKIKVRFDEDTIKILLEIKWWEKPKDEISKFSKDFNDIDSFIIKRKSEDY